MAQDESDAAIGAGLDLDANRALILAGRQLSAWIAPPALSEGSGLFADPDYGLWTAPVQKPVVFSRPEDVTTIPFAYGATASFDLSFANADPCRAMSASGAASLRLSIPAGSGPNAADEHFVDVLATSDTQQWQYEVVRMADPHLGVTTSSFRAMYGTVTIPFSVDVPASGTAPVTISVVLYGNLDSSAQCTIRMRATACGMPKESL